MVRDAATRNVIDGSPYCRCLRPRSAAGIAHYITGATMPRQYSFVSNYLHGRFTKKPGRSCPVSGCGPRLGGGGHQERLGIVMLLEVVAFPAAIDDHKVGHSFERRQDAVPYIATDVDALPRLRDEGERLARLSVKIRRHDDKERVRRQRKEGLAAERMSFDEGQR